MKKSFQFLTLSSLTLVSCLSFSGANADGPARFSRSVQPDASHSPTRQLYWLEDTFNASIFCDPNYVKQLVEGGEFTVASDAVLTASLSDTAIDPYRRLGQSLYAYSSKGVCLEQGFGKGRPAPSGFISFDLGEISSPGPSSSEGLPEQPALEGSTSLLIMEALAMQSKDASGAQVKASIAYQFPSTRKWDVAGEDNTHDFSIYYLNTEGEWVVAETATLEPGRERIRELELRAQLPYAAPVQARLTTRYTKPIYKKSPQFNSESPSPKVARLSVWTETCVPDLSSQEGACI